MLIHYRPRPAFTLIELLIVVAIIAILAAIAVPNFIEAQARSKVSAMKSDMRSLTTAIETYQVDHNRYPLPAAIMAGTQAIVDPMPGWNHSSFDHNYPGTSLTTPISYLSRRPTDLFSNLADQPQPEQNYLYYMSWEYTDELRAAAGGVFNLAQQTRSNAYGPWVMFSCGPDQDRKDVAPAQVGPTNLWNGVYDPTNGTVSNGDIIRSQRNTTGFSL